MNECIAKSLDIEHVWRIRTRGDTSANERSGSKTLDKQRRQKAKEKKRGKKYVQSRTDNWVKRHRVADQTDPLFSHPDSSFAISDNRWPTSTWPLSLTRTRSLARFFLVDSFYAFALYNVLLRTLLLSFSFSLCLCLARCLQ